jgi:predicted CXXCH cytochrome family protein
VKRFVVGLLALALVGAAHASPTFVGTKACAPCHAAASQAWQGSHHAHAMEAPTPDTVRGQFDGATFTKDGVTSTFSRAGDRFVVRTDGPDGALHDYPVAWTFGWAPLQQYLLALPGGRLQALGVAWDTRTKADGGQRWFHLYPNEKIDHHDQLHWTGVQQNWNFMCAECHSTNLVKGYRIGEDRFDTTWTEPNVACEACHGAGSDHVAWAERVRAGTADANPTRGLAVTLGAQGTWALADGAAIARRTAPRSEVQVETCGRCHARGAQVWADDPPGLPLAQTHRVALLDPGLYHADGQIDGEDYEYGSFVQSRMHAAGVACTDCHEPHAGTLRAEGNALCAQCHRPATFDVPAHHHHPAGSAGARCVSCHMPEHTYMVVDGRRDHSLRVPRPDLTVSIGTPNACADCHRDRSATWAAETVAAWRGPGRVPGWHWAEGIHAGRTGRADAAPQLLRIVDDRAVPGIARATAVQMLSDFPTAAVPAAVERASGDADPLVRRAAAETSSRLPVPQRVAVAAPLLRDPMRTVRFEAMGSMLDVAAAGSTVREDMARVIAEYRTSQEYNADRAESWLNLGSLEARLGNADAAKSALETAIRRQPTWPAPYVQLADMQRRQGKEADAEVTLRRGVTAAPRDADMLAALGLSLVRQRRLGEAVTVLRTAAELAPDVSRHAYVYAIALHDSGDVPGSIAALRAAQARNQASPELLMALAQYSAETGDRAGALEWARKLATVTGDPEAQRMVETLAR